MLLFSIEHCATPIDAITAAMRGQASASSFSLALSSYIILALPKVYRSLYAARLSIKGSEIGHAHRGVDADDR